MAYPDMPASGTPVAIVQRDYSDGNGSGGAQTVELGGLDATAADAPTRVELLGHGLSVVARQPLGGVVVDLPVTAGAKTAGTVLGDSYALPGSLGQLPAPFVLWDLLNAMAFDFSAVIDVGELELWLFQGDPGYHDGDTFDVTHASLFSVFAAGAPVVLDRRSDTASSRLLSSASERRPVIFQNQQGWLAVVVRGAGFTLPSSPQLTFALQFGAVG